MLRPAPPRHGPVAQLLIAWSPLSAILVAYAVAAWVNAPLSSAGSEADANRWGFPLHVAGPADADRWAFGLVPSEWLQARAADGGQWYDAVAALVYVTHLVAIPVATAVVWFAVRERFTAWVAAVLTFTVVGVTGYVVYPAAPPWWASDVGVIGPVDRTSHVGWDVLALGPVGDLVTAVQGSSNPVAAMPSLHAGSTLLVALCLWPVAGWAWRAVLASYVAAMAVTLVLTGEHYVVDVVAGWLVAVVAATVGRRVLRTDRPAVASHRA